MNVAQIFFQVTFYTALTIDSVVQWTQSSYWLATFGRLLKWYTNNTTAAAAASAPVKGMILSDIRSARSSTRQGTIFTLH